MVGVTKMEKPRTVEEFLKLVAKGEAKSPFYFDGDVYCPRCGEPWDRRGFTLDFTKEQYDRLIRGRGCPACHRIKVIGLKNLKE